MTTPSSARLTHLSADAHEWKQDYFLWIPLALVAWRLAWKFQDPFISDWDGFDYTVQAVSGQPSPLGLGRALFLGFNHWLWEIAHHLFGLPAEKAYLLFRYAVIAQSGAAIVGMYALAKELTRSRLASAIAAAIFVFSPFFMIYSGRAMSETPGLFMLSWSLWWMFRSLRMNRRNSFLVASLLVGLSANLREFAVFYLWTIPIAARIFGFKWRVAVLALGLAVAAALAGFTFWAIYSPDYYLPAVVNWWSLSARERRLHNISSANFWFLRTYAYQCSVAATLVAPFALAWLYRRRELRVLFVVGLAGLFANLVLLLNHDLSVNPRYLMTGLPGLALVSGWALGELARWRADVSGGCLILIAALQAGMFTQLGKERYDQEWNARAGKAYLSRIAHLPPDSVFIVGARTPLVNFYIGLGARPGWEAIEPGAGWPDAKLESVVRGYLESRRPVFVDFDRDIWNPGARESSREILGLEMIRRNFDLQPVDETLFRVIRHGTPGSAGL